MADETDQTSGIGIVDAIALIKELLFAHLTRDLDARSEIEQIRTSLGEEADGAIIDMARSVVAQTNERLTAFRERLEGVEPAPEEKNEEAAD